MDNNEKVKAYWRTDFDFVDVKIRMMNDPKFFEDFNRYLIDMIFEISVLDKKKEAEFFMKAFADAGQYCRDLKVDIPVFTYLIGTRGDSGPYKIGKSANPQQRALTINRSNPSAYLIAFCEANIESALLSEYKEYCITSEWFDLGPKEVSAIIDQFHLHSENVTITPNGSKFLETIKIQQQ